MEKLRLFIEKYTSVFETDWQTISECFETRIFEKDEVILQEGKICRHLYFIESGLLRFYINKEGNDIRLLAKV